MNTPKEVLGTSQHSDLLSRRTLLTQLTAAGVSAAALGLATSAQAAPRQQQTTSQANGKSGEKNYPMPKPNPRSEAEWRANLMEAATMSLQTSQLATQQASNAAVKQFAGFELNETTGVTTILKEMGTRAPQMDATAQATLSKLRSAQGAEFDTAFLTAQLQTHEYLRDLHETFVSNTAGRKSMPEMHARHLAMLSLPTVREHIAHCQGLLQR